MNGGNGDRSCLYTVLAASDRPGETYTLTGLGTLVLADGTGVAIGGRYVLVDIDGPAKGKQQMGYDVFEFWREGNDLIYYGETTVAGVKDCKMEGHNCTAWVIENENMDYLKCRSSLSATNTTCK